MTPAGSTARGARSEYRGRLPWKPVTNPIGRAILWLLPAPIAKHDALNLFDGRAKYGAIKAWRHGKRRPPQWAVEILERKLRERMAPGVELCEQIYSAVGPGMAAAGTRSLNAWRAAGRPQKQKPAV